MLERAPAQGPGPVRLSELQGSDICLEVLYAPTLPGGLSLPACEIPARRLKCDVNIEWQCLPTVHVHY